MASVVSKLGAVPIFIFGSSWGAVLQKNRSPLSAGAACITTIATETRTYTAQREPCDQLTPCGCNSGLSSS
jgi:hypothetical protein